MRRREAIQRAAAAIGALAGAPPGGLVDDVATGIAGGVVGGLATGLAAMAPGSAAAATSTSASPSAPAWPTRPLHLLVAYPPGSVVLVPPRVSHFGASVDGVEFQEMGTGPTATDFVKKDDVQKK